MQTQQIFLNGDIGFDVTLANIMGAVKLYPEQEIEFVVKSWGGYVDEAWRIYDYLKTVSNVSVIFKDVCCSATTFAFLSLPLAKRKAYKNTQFAIHLPFNSYMFEDMNVETLETDAKRLREITNEILACYEKHLNISIEEINSLITPDSFFNETAAMGFKMISEVLEAPENENGMDWVFDLTYAKSRIAAFYPKSKTNQNQNDMTDIKEIKEELSGFKAILNKVLNFINPAKNIMVSSEEGETINFEGEVIEVGTKTVGDVPDGTYTIMYMEKKYTVTIAGNAVTEMIEVEVETPSTDEPSETDKMQAEIDRLTAELEAANIAKNELETAKAQVVELTAVKNEFETVKAQLSQIKSKHFNPDTNEWNFTGKFEDATNAKANVTKTEMEQKVKEIKTKFKNK